MAGRLKIERAIELQPAAKLFHNSKSSTMNRTFLNVNNTHTVESYPYGRLRCKAFFSVEFVKGKGFRTVFQTINPKNGRLNAPKKSTYGRGLICQYMNNDNGHIEALWLDFYDTDKLATHCQKLAEILPAISATPEMIKYLAEQLYLSLKVSIMYAIHDQPAHKVAILDHFKPLVSILSDMNATGNNRFAEIEKHAYRTPKQVADLTAALQVQEAA